VLILRIKQAESALSDGRLDEAFELLGAADLRAHRRGQELAGKLARAMVKRGREHLEGGRLAQAGSDGEKAVRLGGNLPEAAELRTAVVGAMTFQQREAQMQAQAVVAAGRQIEQGQLSIGQKLLNGVQDGNGRAAAMLQEVAGRRVMIEAIAEKASAALGRDDWETAVGELARAREAKLVDSRLREMMGQVSRMLVEKIESAVQSGRLDLAASLLKRLSRASEPTLQSEQLVRAVEQCRAAWTWIECGQPRQAEEILRRLTAVLPSAEWIESALKSLRQAGDAMRELRGGPLGLLDDGRERVNGEEHSEVMPMRTRMSAADKNVCPTIPCAADKNVCPTIPCAADKNVCPTIPCAADKNVCPTHDGCQARMLIQVDGIGSFLVVRQPRVTIGPVSASPAVDVGLQTDANTPPITIERVDEDYFVRSASSVMVNDKPCRKKLLTGGDRIALSLRCRMSFRRPSAASTSAVLDLHSARLSRGDVRHVILMDRELILGPGGGAHIRADDLPEAAVLVVRDGQWFCRAKSAMMIDGKAAQKTSAIPMGCQVQVGTVTFVVTMG
jgi:hypothetical protein